MKKVYHKFMSLLVVLVAALQANAGTWSYDWPISATKDKEAGFYNLGSDKTLTTQTRILKEREWTINVPEGCYLGFTTTSGQIVGKVESGVLPVDGFNLVSFRSGSDCQCQWQSVYRIRNTVFYRRG